MQIEIIYKGDLSTLCLHESGAYISTDAPKDNRGQGRFFSPTDLLATALGSCVLTIMGIQANSLNVDIKDTKLLVDKEMSATPPRRISKLRVKIFCPHIFSKEIIEKLERAALACPVHQSLHPDIIQDFEFHWG